MALEMWEATTWMKVVSWKIWKVGVP